MTSILNLDNVSVHNAFESRLQNINLTIHRGEQIALLGESGSGKSTLIQVCNGSILPSSGKIKWRGAELKNSTQRQRTRIATIWQDLHLVEELNVLQNINIGALGRHSLLWAFRNLIGTIEKETCLICLEATGLDKKLLTKSVQKLSGGQRQRVAIARLLRQQAELLLADEPLSSLDPNLASKILNLLLSKNEMYSIYIPKTCLISLHKEDLIANFSRVIGLKKGEIVIDSSTTILTKSEINSLYMNTCRG